MKPPSLSFCLVIKNEEEFLKTCLNSLQALKLPILILDTGSTDKSLSIIQDFPSSLIELHTTEWRDDFAWARNHLAQKAKTEWVFFIDGDESLDLPTFSLLEESLTPEVGSISVIQRNYTEDSATQDARRTAPPASLGKWPTDLYAFDNWMERIYRPASGVSYEGRVHESLIPSCQRLGRAIVRIPIVLHHFGRLKTGHQKKWDYYLKLSEMKLKEFPNHPASWIEWLINLCEVQKFKEALPFAERAVTKFPDEPEVLRTAYQVALRAENYVQAEQWIRQQLKKENQISAKQRIDAYENLGTALLYQGKWEECADVCQKVIQEDASNFLSHLNLGIISFEKKDWASAKHYLSAALKQKPYDSFLIQALKRIPTT